MSIRVSLVLRTIFHLPSMRHLSYDDCLEDKREDYQNCSVLYCVTQFCTVICTACCIIVTRWGGPGGIEA